MRAAAPHYADASPALLAQEAARPDDTPSRRPVEPGWPALRTHLEARLAAMRQWRASWWAHFAEIARYQLPRRYLAHVTANSAGRGSRQDWNIVDSTATLDGEDCAGGMMSVIFPPNWLHLGPAIPGLELDRAGQMYYQDWTERLLYLYDNSNFYESAAQLFEDVTFFGTGVVIDYEDGDEILACRNPCAGEYMLAAGSDLNNQSLYTEERRTVSQIVEMFGLKVCPDEIRRMWAQKGGALENEFVVGCAIEPNFAIAGDSGASFKVPGNFAWREVYWLVGKSEATAPLSVAGFHEKPHSVLLWHKQSNDPYGRGPGATGLGDTVQLQLETIQKAEALEKVVKPPMGADPALKNEPASVRPGSITYYDTSTGKKGFHPLYEVRPDLAAMTADIVDIRSRIGRAFHADLFRLIQGLIDVRRDVSATEVDALREERLMRLGPFIGRTYKEGIRPRIHRHIGMMERAGLAPKKPRSLANVPMEPEFISMLTLAQRAGLTNGIERTFAFVGNLSAAYQGTPDDPKLALDPIAAVREYGELRGLKAQLLRSPADIKRLQDQMRQAAQQAALAQNAMAGVQGAKVMSETDIGGGRNALGAVLGTA